MGGGGGLGDVLHRTYLEHHLLQTWKQAERGRRRWKARCPSSSPARSGWSSCQMMISWNGGGPSPKNLNGAPLESKRLHLETGGAFLLEWMKVWELIILPLDAVIKWLQAWDSFFFFFPPFLFHWKHNSTCFRNFKNLKTLKKWRDIPLCLLPWTNHGYLSIILII